MISDLLFEIIAFGVVHGSELKFSYQLHFTTVNWSGEIYE